MPVPAQFQSRLTLPMIAAPMFLVSGIDLVTACCRNGGVGTFPALNTRSSELLDQWLDEIDDSLAADGADAAPYGVNLVIHRSNPRLEADLDLLVKHKTQLVITSIGDPTPIVERIHGYGGLVFHDVTTVRHARKAAAAGVDGLILVCAGAGGHAGTLSPFALVPQVRAFYDGAVALAGCINDGRGVRAAQVLGADMAYIGTRFIAVREAMASADYKRTIVESAAADILYTPAFSGIPANTLKPSIAAAGLDANNLLAKKRHQPGRGVERGCQGLEGYLERRARCGRH